MSPVRIQRKRTKGWRMPGGAVYVGRPTRWGNQFRTDDDLGQGLEWDHETVVELHRLWITAPWMTASLPYLLEPLRGRDLVCWCPLDQPCHADVLLELANASVSVSGV
jgi:uncharacterized protein DUF4326